MSRTANRHVAWALLLTVSLAGAQTPEPVAVPGLGPQPAGVLDPQDPALVEPAAAPATPAAKAPLTMNTPVVQPAPAPATAAPPPAPVAAAPAAFAPAAGASLAIPAPQASLDETMQNLAGLQAQVATAQVQMQLLSQQTAINQLQKQQGGQATGTSDIPELVGIVGTPGNLEAEFLSSGSLLTARNGEWVTPEWKLVNIMGNGVELTKKNGRERHTILFGHRTNVVGNSILTPAFAGQPQMGMPAAANQGGQRPATPVGAGN